VQENGIVIVYAHDVEVGDLNGDNKLDVVTCGEKAVIIWIQGATPVALSKRFRRGVRSCGHGSGRRSRHPVRRVVVGIYPSTVKVRTGEMDNDGDLDFVVSGPEGSAALRWYAAPMNPKTSTGRTVRVVTKILLRAHSLQLADFDLDGRPDSVTAQMHTSTDKLILAYVQ
jgi:FG-GAP-like repeat